ncbi:unnamed protein product [Rhizoctonia solani]|uniref:Protein kinase domain-containing protein n=1 Tax=Rhizoctonia solani TaxID=456999 RepID=A0A8H3DPH9_9AGAM|nr:unnamed protein product [Rhizoctonia solani]
MGRVADRPDSSVSVRYSSPELLMEDAVPTPESDMWSFGCVAFWIYTDLPPYPRLKKEYEIVRAIEDGVVPNSMESIRDIEALGSHLKTGADSPWITNGTLSHIFRCWDPQPGARPTAGDILAHLERLPSTNLIQWSPPASVPDLTGAIQTPGGFTTDPTHIGSHLKVPALITEYCSNGRLRAYCTANHETMSERERINMIRGIAKALKYLHNDIPEGSIVHGSLSMDSVVVDADGVPKLTNFEFSCQYQHSDNPLRAPVLHAPPLASHPTRWDAPELFQDVSDSRAPFPTRYTDLWSLGSLIVFVSPIYPIYQQN